MAPISPNLSLPGEDAVGDPAAEGLPKRFGKYTLLRKLAMGGMAELFLAIQRSVAGFEKLIVIKRILPSMTQDKSFIEMLLHEARIAATLSHANIVQIFDVGQVDGIYYIAMEHVHGEDLRSIVRQMRKKGVTEFPLEHAIGIMMGVCGGLAYAHEKRDLDGTPLHIVHRDISPQNVVVTFAGDVKIVDFGIAKSDNKIGLETRSGKLKGKVPYMSPEQAQGQQLDARSDIFAVGVMLFELTTGKRLFKGESEFETLKLICEREYPLPSQIRPGYPAELEPIVMKALEKDRSRRYQSARDMQAALEEYVRDERIPVSAIATTHFMQELFEEKLASQKEALLQGKQLADIIELQQPIDPGPPSEGDVRVSASVLSAPAAARTVTDLAPASGRGRLVAAAIVLPLVVVGLGGGYWAWAHRPVPAIPIAIPTPLPLPAPPIRGSLQITSDPAGASIWISGDLRPEVTPATISDLPTGRAIDVKLTMDGFETAKQSVMLTDGQPSQLAMTLPHGSVSIDVSVSPAAAKPVLLIDGKATQGLSADGLASGDQHKLVVGAPGYVDQTFAFLGEPQEKKHFDVVLVRETHRSSHPSVATASQAAGTGKINIGASGGWCNVSIDGVARGATPVAGIELPAGPHRVTCSATDHPAMTATVVIPADGTARYRFTLQ